MSEILRFKAAGPWITRDLKDCVLASAYDAVVASRDEQGRLLAQTQQELEQLKEQLKVLNARNAELAPQAEFYHEAMTALRQTTLEHGTCLPRERRACTHCAGREKLEALQKSYKGRRIILAARGGIS